LDGLSTMISRLNIREKALGLSLLSFLKLPAVLLLSFTFILSGCGTKGTNSDPVQSILSENVPFDTVSPPSPSAPAVQREAASTYSIPSAKPGKNLTEGMIPKELLIPSLGIKAPIVSLGLTKEGAMDVPSNDSDVGWFAPGYRPGTQGHAVLAGHVDSKEGPAVFYKLKDLGKGDKIILKDGAGIELEFQVAETHKYPYDDSPLDEIFGPSDSPMLNIITCTGLYSRSLGTHQQRLVVTAELIKTS
jgi:sortase A